MYRFFSNFFGANVGPHSFSFNMAGNKWACTLLASAYFIQSIFKCAFFQFGRKCINYTLLSCILHSDMNIILIVMLLPRTVNSLGILPTLPSGAVGKRQKKNSLWNAADL